MTKHTEEYWKRKRAYLEVYKMHKRRESDEHLEIVCYIAKKVTLDESDIKAISEEYKYLNKELQKRINSLYANGGQRNRNDAYLQERVKELRELYRKISSEGNTD